MFPSSPAIPLLRRCAPRMRSARKLSFWNPIRSIGRTCPTFIPIPIRSRRIGIEKYVEAYRVYPQARNEEVTAHAEAMAWKLQGADPERRYFAVVALNMLDPLLDAMETPQRPPARGTHYEIQLLNPHPDCLAEITIEYPYLQERYEFSGWR